MASQTTPTFFSTPKAFRQWLERHADSAPELLVGFHKVGSGRPSMGWSESVDEALCFGWIDGIRRRIDEYTYSIRFTPRKPSSIWSAVNIAKVERPAPMLRAFQRNKAAWRFFQESTPPSYRKSMLHWVASAKRDATREARFAELVAACAAGERIELWAKRPPLRG